MSQITLQPINPLQYITEHMPTPEGAKNVASWFETEHMELNFGDYVGRPSENVQARLDTLPQLFTQGWYVAAVKRSASDGEWVDVIKSSGASRAKSKSESTAKTNASSESSSEAESNGRSESEAASFTYSQSSANTSTHQGDSGSSGTSNGATTGTGNTSSRGENENHGTEKAVGKSASVGNEVATGESEDSSEETTEKTDPYWCAYSLIRLERRRMQAENVLKDMVKSLVDAYNEGRKINVERYDEIVALYALMLSRTEDEANSLTDPDIDFGPLFDMVKDAITKALNEYKEVANALPDDWLENRKAEINRKFDALIGQKKAEMVTNGTFNGTVWPSVESGIERDRQYALNDLKDDMFKLKLDAYKDVATITDSTYNGLVSAQVRIFEALQKQKLDPVNLRNSVFKWMLDFMEHRTDAYPGLDQLTTIAERLGYSGGIGAPK